MNSTPEQRIAIETAGNILVAAGAGAGKTGTLVARCLRMLLRTDSPVDISRLLIVTFTESAAAEVRERIRRELDAAAAERPRDLRIQEQIARLDSAPISTLHSFCYSLVREHFYDLDLDPSVTVLPSEQAEMLFQITFEELLHEHYLGNHSFSADLKEILRTHFGGWDKRLLTLIQRLHHFTQTRADPGAWFRAQFQRLDSKEPEEWRRWYAQAVQSWCREWVPYLESLSTENLNAHHCAGLLKKACMNGDLSVARAILERKECWPDKKKTEHAAPFKKLFEEADFLESLSVPAALEEDWNWSRGPLRVVLQFAQQFATCFNAAKKSRGAVDFHDLEQYALRLLWDSEAQRPTAIAEAWRNRLEAVFVDEYQDINAAQDLIISTLSREDLPGNRFLVGDIKQSIYRFRQAEPAIFREYLERQSGWKKSTLSDNFRSHEGILDWINPLFAWLMQGPVSGIVYDENSKLRFGSRETRAEMSLKPGERLPVELNLLVSNNNRNENPVDDSEGDEPELENAEKEAHLVARRLRKLREDQTFIYHQKERQTRPVDWKDMVVLLRASSGKLEVYAKAFEAAGIPLQTRRDGFFTTPEVLDLLNVLTILDNPLQDIPLVSVLRSPLVGMTSNELAIVRAQTAQGRFWNALHPFIEVKKDSPARQKIELFLQRFHRWRDPRASASLAQRLELILSDTGYSDWLLSQPRGRQRHANLQQILRVAREFDETRGESLYHFLRHIQALQEAAGDIEPAPNSEENAVRLMTVHQSKGLEFPVVAVADLGKQFNTTDQRSSLLLHEKFGLCAAIKSPNSARPYTSLPLWLAARDERVAAMAEEMRVFYVALTRPENLLLLFGSTTEGKIKKQWQNAATAQPFPQQLLALNSMLDWIGAYGTLRWPGCFSASAQIDPPFTVTLHSEAPASIPAGKIAERHWSAEEVSALNEKVSFRYPHSTAITQPAKASVSALRRKAVEAEEEITPLENHFNFAVRSVDGRERGIATHAFLQHHDPQAPTGAENLRAQAAELAAAGILTPAQIHLIDFEAIADFWVTDFGRSVSSRIRELHRELNFTVKLSGDDIAPLHLEQILSIPAGEFILVQGIADFVVLGRDEIWLLDFKTDQLNADELSARVNEYRPQLALYALALERIYHRPVTRAGLYFLALRRISFL